MRRPGALIFCILLGCNRIHPPAQAPSFDDEVREYVRLAVALGERDPDALDFYFGPVAWVADTRRKPPSLQQIRLSAAQAIARLARLEGLPESLRSRRRFLVGQLNALEARAGLLAGKRRSFDDESQALFGIRPSAVIEEQQVVVREKLARLLIGSGNLADRFEAFDARFTIVPGRLAEVMTRALQACRAETIAHLNLPSEERVSIEYVSNKAWSAYSYYQGNFHSVIRINTDFGLTVDRALQLACHEGYPGHHVFNSLADVHLVRGGNRFEFFVQPTFSPQSFVSEAAATLAPEIAFSEPERIRVERDVLFPLAGLNSVDAEHYVRVAQLAGMLYAGELAVARDYLDGKLEFVRAATALEDRVLMAHSDATLRYLNEYRSYVITYTEGLDLMRKWIDARVARSHSQEGRWGPFRELAANPELFFQQ
jgi:hypothetical protein